MGRSHISEAASLSMRTFEYGVDGHEIGSNGYHNHSHRKG